MNLLPKFFTIPFVFYTSFLILGILFAPFFHLSVFVVGLLFISLILITKFSLGLSYNFNGFRSIFLFGSLFFLGVLLFKLSHSPKDNVRSNSNYYTFNVVQVTKGKSNWNKTIVQLNNALVSGKLVPTNEKVLIYVQNEIFEPGDVVFGNISLNPIKNDNNPGGFNQVSYWNNKGIYRMAFVDHSRLSLMDHIKPSVFLSWSSSIRAFIENIVDQSLDEGTSSMVKAILIGSKSDLSSEVKTSFSKAGAMHVLAVSGLHVGIILGVLIFILSKFNRILSRSTALIIAVAIIWVYADRKSVV